MLNKREVANFLLSLDKEGIYFNKNLISRNGHKFYEGNARLNKILHLAQNIYLAKTGTMLINADFYAYDNGAVIPEIQSNYAMLVAKKNDCVPTNITQDELIFLKKVYSVFKDAPIDELIEIDHEDSEWIEKHQYVTLQEQKMDTFAKREEYKEQYADIVKVLDRMAI